MVDIQRTLVYSAILAAVTCVFLTKLSQPKLFILIGLLVAALLSESIYRFSMERTTTSSTTFLEMIGSGMSLRSTRRSVRLGC